MHDNQYNPQHWFVLEYCIPAGAFQVPLKPLKTMTAVLVWTYVKLYFPTLYQQQL